MSKMKFAKKLICVAGACAVMVAAAVPAFAADPKPGEGKTTVYYTSENIVPGPNNAKWGVKIPATITLTNYAVKAPGDLELVSLKNDKTLKELYTELIVSTTISSENGFQFVDSTGATTDRVGGYKYQLDNKNVENNVKVPEDFTLEKTKKTGFFELTTKVNKAGKYKDTLTFTFGEVKATENTNP